MCCCQSFSISKWRPRPMGSSRSSSQASTQHASHSGCQPPYRRFRWASSREPRWDSRDITARATAPDTGCSSADPVDQPRGKAAQPHGLGNRSRSNSAAGGMRCRNPSAIPAPAATACPVHAITTGSGRQYQPKNRSQRRWSRSSAVACRHAVSVCPAIPRQQNCIGCARRPTSTSKAMPRRLV